MESLFRQFVQEKKRFLLPAIVFLFVFYFSLPLTLAFFPQQMSATLPFINLSWGWLYAFAQFIMTWLLCWMYWHKAKHFDQLVERMQEENR